MKFFSDAEREELKQKLDMEEGDLVLFGCDQWHTVCEVLGRLRHEYAVMCNVLKGKEGIWNFLWVTDFPLLHYSEEDQKWNAVHHPFTRPRDEDLDLLKAGEYAQVRAQAYDVVLNGYELGGGSIRIHEKDLQAQMFDVLGVTKEEQQTLFAHILEAFQFGAPPHGGIALGLDRIVMLACGEESIREVIAFPKNNKGLDLMSDSPAEVDFKQLREIYIQSTAKKDKP